MLLLHAAENVPQMGAQLVDVAQLQCLINTHCVMGQETCAVTNVLALR